MKTIEGAISSAALKSSRTSLGPSPRYFWMSSEPTTRRKVAEVEFAFFGDWGGWKGGKRKREKGEFFFVLFCSFEGKKQKKHKVDKKVKKKKKNSYHRLGQQRLPGPGLPVQDYALRRLDPDVLVELRVRERELDRLLDLLDLGLEAAFLSFFFFSFLELG